MNEMIFLVSCAGGLVSAWRFWKAPRLYAFAFGFFFMMMVIYTP